MAKSDNKAKIDQSIQAGQLANSGKDRPARTVAGSVLAKPMSKGRSKSEQVLKAVSSAHSEALIRLKDR